MLINLIKKELCGAMLRLERMNLAPLDLVRESEPEVAMLERENLTLLWYVKKNEPD